MSSAEAREERLDAHLGEAGDRRRRVVGVQRGQHEVARERRLDAMRAVSASRISPTMITSGSARSIERRPLAKVSPDLAFTCSWLMPGSWYSTGSSIVMMFLSIELIEFSAEYRVVDLPEPVGPVTSVAPCALRKPDSNRSRASPSRPEGVEAEHGLALVEDSHHDALAMHRRQGDDADVDRVALDLQPHPAVLGNALLGDVEVAHDLHAGDHAGDHPARDGGDLAEHAVDAKAHAHVAAVGLEVQVRGAGLHGLGDDRVHELDDRGVLGGLTDVGDRGHFLVAAVVLDRLSHRVVEAAHAPDQARHVLGGGHGGPDVVARSSA